MNKIICFLLTIMMIMSCFAACGFESVSNDDGPAIIGTVKVEEPTSPKETIVQVGEVVSFNNFNITYKAAELETKYSSSDSNKKIIAYTFNFENVGKNANWAQIKCYVDDFEMEPYLFGDYAVLTSVYLTEGAKESAIAYFEVPADVNPEEIELYGCVGLVWSPDIHFASN